MMFFFFTEPNGLDGLGSRFLIDTSAYVSQLLIPSHACVRASSHQRRHRHALHCNANPTSPPSSREHAVFSAGELERRLAAALTPSIRSELQQSNQTPSLLLRPPLDSSPVLSESHMSTTQTLKKETPRNPTYLWQIATTSMTLHRDIQKNLAPENTVSRVWEYFFSSHFSYMCRLSSM